MEDEAVAPLVLSVFTFLGKYKPIGKYITFKVLILFSHANVINSVCILDLMFLRFFGLS
jgi:hypothetical protein